MPFKLKLKKTRQYNVASKSLFVISVELLDGGIADCTLSVDSTGQECLDNVCQRQAINQPEFFGLRYVNNAQQYHWVELDRPLKKQLDKHASSQQLHLRVMYYITTGTSLITDEVTRNHYFLQLKNDLVEGRIICDYQQAVVLASYSRQAEYGNHDRERHTVDYLKNLLTFPKQIIDGGQVIDGGTLAETGRLEWLTSAVIQHHIALHNMSQAQAEEGFITVCQSLKYYGQEMFSAREVDKQVGVTICVSLNGITILTQNDETKHRWQDITNVINQKRTFTVECTNPSDTKSLLLATPEEGKYVWRMCILQHTFYMKHQAALSKLPSPEPRPQFQDLGTCESREELDRIERSTSALEPLTSAHRAFSTSCLELAPPLTRSLVPQYRPAPDYETAIQQKYQQQQVEVGRYPSHGHPLTKPLLYSSHPDIHRVYPDVTHVARHTNHRPHYLAANYTPLALNPNLYVDVYKPPPPYPSNGLASNSTPDLAAAGLALYRRAHLPTHLTGSSPDLVSHRTALNRHYLNSQGAAGYHGRVTPSAHGTYNNLNSVADPNGRLNPHYITENVHDYGVQIHRAPYRRHVVLPQTQPIQKMSDADEPIYENIPLPWQNDRAARDRAHSLTTTEEIARLNERNGGRPAVPNVNIFNDRNANRVPNFVVPPSIKITDATRHYVNAQVIKDVRDSGAPKDLNVSTKSINKGSFENITLSVDRLSLTKSEEKSQSIYEDETPYQSLSTHRINNNFTKSADNVTSVSVPDIKATNISISNSSGLDSGIVNSSAYSIDSENSKNTTVSSKEKKRRRWGVFLGRTNKNVEVKSATLGRDRTKNPSSAANKHRWSTGLPKFQPLPPSITKETMCQLLERRMSEDQLSFAFEQIPKARECGGDMTTALLPHNAPLNGFSSDHLPYEDNRVRLSCTSTNPSGYINASHITMTVGSSQRFYIVCLYTPAASSALWECAWQSGATVMVLLGDCQIPPLNTTHCYGDWRVQTVSCGGTSWGATSALRLSHAHAHAHPHGQPARTLYHAQCRAWGDDVATPDPALFLRFLGEVHGLRMACAPAPGTGTGTGTALHNKNAPLIVCCKQGAGRSGVALAADLLIHTIDHNQELDIPRTINLLHQQRANLIQNVEQYKFLHQVLLLYLKQSRLI